jgi:hypothetical protein
VANTIATSIQVVTNCAQPRPSKIGAVSVPYEEILLPTEIFIRQKSFAGDLKKFLNLFPFKMRSAIVDQV